MIERDTCLQVARCMRTHGVQGAVVLQAGQGFDVDSFSYDFLFFDLDGGLVPFYVEEIREKGAGEAIIKFEDVMTQENARRIIGADVYVDRTWLDDEDYSDFTPGTLAGYVAVDNQTGELGIITGIQEIAKNPLFVIDNHGDEILIPVVDEFIDRIEEAERKVFFNLPEGLLDL